MLGNHIGGIISIIFMAFALVVDAFSISLGMGMQQIRLRRVAMIGMVFGLFHVIFPFVGMIVGKLLSEKIGDLAVLIGGLLLVGIGVQMILNALNYDVNKIVQPFGLGLLFLAFSVSIDSFPVGLSLGMSGVRIAFALVMFGLISTVLTWIGLLIGRKIRGFLGVYSEILGGSVLITFGLKVIFGS